MKQSIILVSLAFFMGFLGNMAAQDMAYATNLMPNEAIMGVSAHDYTESSLSNTDTIPDFESTQNKIKLTGIIYNQDGKTPAKDVVLALYQKNEDGSFELLKHKDKSRSVRHSGAIKTDADGRYTFYTFIPGKALRSHDLKEIHLVLKEPNKEEAGLYPIVFDNDPLLSKSCRKKLARRGINNIVALQTEQGLQVGSKDIILIQDSADYK